MSHTPSLRCSDLSCADLIEGQTPLHLFNAPLWRTGKTLVAKVCAMPGVGEVAVRVWTRDEAENRKRLTALLSAAPPVVLLDNLTGHIDSESLAAVFTSGKWTDRLMGSSVESHAINRSTWLGTMNNASISGELIGRTVLTQLDAGVDDPSVRTGFRHPQLLNWMTKHRGEMVAACLTIAQAWLAANRPPGSATLGGFESWATTMSGMLAHAGIDGLLDNREDFKGRAGHSDATDPGVRCCMVGSIQIERGPGRSALSVGDRAFALTSLMRGDSDHARKIRLASIVRQNLDRTFKLDAEATVKVTQVADRDGHRKVNLYRLDVAKRAESPMPFFESPPAVSADSSHANVSENGKSGDCGDSKPSSRGINIEEANVFHTHSALGQGWPDYPQSIESPQIDVPPTPRCRRCGDPLRPPRMQGALCPVCESRDPGAEGVE